MGKGLEVITGFATAPGATLTALTMSQSDSLQVRNTNLDNPIRLLDIWTKNQANGNISIHSPNMHDNVLGINLLALTADGQNKLWRGAPQPLIPQDQLIAQISGSAVVGEIEIGNLLIYYEDLPGIAARLIDPDELATRIEDLIGVSNVITPTVAGEHSGTQAINAVNDLFEANRDYAILGYIVDTLSGNICYRGSDSGNLRVGGPADPTIPFITKDWFVKLSRDFKKPLIPVWNAANKNSLFVDTVQDQALTAVNVTTIMALLK